MIYISALLGIRNFLNVGKDVTNAFKDIVEGDTGIKNSITQAGGLLSLIGVGLKHAKVSE